jgi:RNA polymerase sigma-70 factor (ECF subfamily)
MDRPGPSSRPPKARPSGNGHLRPQPAGPAAAEPTDRELVHRARTDPSGFAELYRRHVERVYGYAYRRSGSSFVAEDVTAATFEAALRALPRFDADGVGFGAWVLRIASNQLVDHYRRQGREHTPRGQRAMGALAGSGADDNVIDLETAASIDEMMAAMAALRPRYRDALHLRFLSGLTPDEAAEVMGCSKATLAVVVHRAIGSMRKAMAAEAVG